MHNHQFIRVYDDSLLEWTIQGFHGKHGHKDSYFLYDAANFSAEVVLYKKTPAHIIRDKKNEKEIERTKKERGGRHYMKFLPSILEKPR